MLRDKVVVITGAAGGLGRATVSRVAKEGGIPVLVDVARDRLEESAKALGNILAFAGDASDPSFCEQVRAEVSKAYDRCDVLVNAAGLSRPGEFGSLVAEDWLAVTSANMHSVYFMSRAMAKLMLPRRQGAIVNIASLGAYWPNPRGGAYSSSKASVVMLTKHSALVWGPQGVRCNSISPGILEAAVSGIQRTGEAATRMERMTSKIPLGRIGTYDEVARVVVFLASDQAAYISGADIVVDGGWSTTLLS